MLKIQKKLLYNISKENSCLSSTTVNTIIKTQYTVSTEHLKPM